MAKNQCILLAALSLFTAGKLCADTAQSPATVANVESYNWLILLVAVFAVAVVVVVALCRRCRRRTKLHGLSHML